MRQVGRLLAAVFVLTAVWGWSATAKAEPSFFNVKVDLIGTATVGILVFRLTDTNTVPVFTSKAFVYTGLLQKEHLAITLTAIALDTPVFIFTDPFAGEVPAIVLMFLRGDQ